MRQLKIKHRNRDSSFSKCVCMKYIQKKTKKDKKREKRLKGIWCVRMVCGLFLGKTHEKSMNAWYSRQELSGASFTQSTKGWIKAKGKSSSIVFYSILCVFWLLLFLVFHFIRKLLESIFEIGHWPYSWFRLNRIGERNWFKYMIYFLFSSLRISIRRFKDSVKWKHSFEFARWYVQNSVSNRSTEILID